MRKKKERRGLEREKLKGKWREESIRRALTP